MMRSVARSISLTILIAVAAVAAMAQTMDSGSHVNIPHHIRDFSITAFNNAAWRRAGTVTINRYWSGEAAPAGRQVTARLLWTDTALYVRFDAAQDEPLVVSAKPNLKTKTMGLWDRDVCEIFIAPNKATPSKYFEFEVAPNGEWIDLAIHVTSQGRLTDWDYRSDMQTAAKVGKGKVTMAIKIPWSALGRKPARGDVWLGNLFRCVGKDPDRGYLAWRPTSTEKPNFHVPESFGQFIFLGPPSHPPPTSNDKLDNSDDKTFDSVSKMVRSQDTTDYSSEKPE